MTPKDPSEVGVQMFAADVTVDPPQLEPAPAVQPKQWRPTTIDRPLRASARKAPIWPGAPSATPRSSI